MRLKDNVRRNKEKVKQKCPQKSAFFYFLYVLPEAAGGILQVSAAKKLFGEGAVAAEIFGEGAEPGGGGETRGSGFEQDAQQNTPYPEFEKMLRSGFFRGIDGRENDGLPGLLPDAVPQKTGAAAGHGPGQLHGGQNARPEPFFVISGQFSAPHLRERENKRQKPERSRTLP